MKLSEVSVRRGVTFLMLYIVIVGFGIFSLMRLGLDLYPDISFPVVITIVQYEGANPEDIETLVTKPLESAVAAVDGVESIRSDSKQGVSLVIVEFDWGTDMEQAETDIRRAIDMIEGYLPDDSDAPMIFAFDPSMQPIVMTTVSGPYPLDVLRYIADEEVAPLVERIDGVAAAEASGGLVREIQIVLDPHRIEAYKLDVTAVMGAVYAGNNQQSGGYIEQGIFEFEIKTNGKYKSVEEIGEVVVGARPTTMGAMQPIRLKEVASIIDGFAESRRVLETDGQSSVWLIIRKQSGANTVQAAEKVMKVLESAAADTGRDLKFETIFDQSDFINNSISNLSSSAIQGVIITFFVLLFFLFNFRASLIVALAVPISVVATFGLMQQAGMTLNVLSLAGLALAVGMLVDNSIVVMENIFFFRQKGEAPWNAAIKGASTVGLAVTASTLTTLVVFLPVLFVPGIAGVLFNDMAITICFSLTVSLLVALTFIPLASSRLLGSSADNPLKRSEMFQEKTLGWLYRGYGRAIDWVLGHRWVVVSSVVGMLLVTGVMYKLMPTEFMMEGDDGFMVIRVEAPVGTNLDETYRILDEVRDRVADIVPEKDRKLIALDVGLGEGFTAIVSKGTHAGIIRVPLISSDNRETSLAQYEDLLRDALKEYPGVTFTIGRAGPLRRSGDIELQILGFDLDQQRRVGLELKTKLAALPEVGETTFSMADQKPQMEVDFDRRKLAELGLSSGTLSQAISVAFQGKTVAMFSDGGDEYDIKMRFDEKFRNDLDNLRKMPIVTTTGGIVPLDNVADIETRLGPTDITRLDQERYTTVSVTLKDKWVDENGKSHRKDLGAAIKKITGIADQYPMPEGFTYKVAGTAEDFMTSFLYLGLALMVSVLLVFMVMASQFESLREPFIILFTVPLASIGVVLMFVLTRSTLDMAAIIGVIMLTGIVVNNGIIMVDAANQIREEGFSRLDAIAMAGKRRLRPVLMTSLTTILGMVPMALGIGEGAEIWAGLGKAVIGGLTIATLLTLFVVPIMYTVFARKELKYDVKVHTGTIEVSPSSRLEDENL